MKGKWIWLDSRVYPQYQRGRNTFFCPMESKFCVATFVRCIEAETDTRVRIRMAADTKYVLWIDGKRALRAASGQSGDYDDRGPASSFEYDTLFFDWERGEHCVRVDVLGSPQMVGEVSKGRGGLWAEITLELQGGGKKIVTTDGEWKAFPNACFPEAGVYRPYAYRERDTFVECVADVWHAVPRRADLPVYEPISVQSVAGKILSQPDEKIIRIDGSGELRIDLGKVYTFYPHLEIRARGRGRGKLILQTAEAAREYLMGGETVEIRRGTQIYDSLHYRSGRFVDIVFENCGGVEIIPKFQFCHYPVEYRGSFSCSDESLNKIYRAGIRTVLLCMQDKHLDSPVHQEPLSCIGDYRIISLVNYCAYGNYSLTRADILRTAEHLAQRDYKFFHTTYTLIWIRWVREYLLWSGDEKTVRTVLPVVSKVIERYLNYRDETGLIANSPNFLFVDWVHVGGYSLHHPPQVLGQGVLNCFMYDALRQYSFMLRRFGEDGEARRMENEAARLRDAFHRLLWNEEKGMYREGLEENTDAPADPWRPAGSGEFYQMHTNSLAVLYGLAQCDPRALMERIVNDPSLVKPQPYFMHYVLEALAEVGLFGKYGLPLIREWAPLIDVCETGMAECWTERATAEGDFSDDKIPNYTYDFSHGWGTTPCYHLATRVLGIRPASDGFADFKIEPDLGDLDWAQGQIPTPRGVITVKVWKEDGKIVKDIRFRAYKRRENDNGQQ